ncbi:MAG: putative baseplate assembly protein [Actinobacteria bacterium 13_2_20CM_2_71_6]|nr:MAG: putative baseplate assembly protein [Actinobacteria bacterium 13_2_20CM_2_71_6]
MTSTCTSSCTCGCCEGIRTETPVVVANPPGQPAIAYRTGTYGRFLASMLARLSSPGYPALSSLTVRSPDDPAIALLDDWAIVGDVVTFYTERIANEGYLRTATEDSSLRLLGRLVGYAPRPGIAAGTYLAYTLDKDPTGRDTPVTIPRGSRAQSVPAPGEDAQAYETAEDLVARWSWNDLKIRLRQPIQLTKDDLAQRTQLQLAGAALHLKPGDRLLFVFGTTPGAQELKVVRQAEVDQVSGVTVVSFPAPVGTVELAQDWAALTAAAVQDEMYGRSRIVRRFVDEALAPAPTGPTTPAELAAQADAALHRLAEDATAARPYENVHRWFVESIRPALSAFRDRAVRLAGQAAPAAGTPMFTALGLDRPVRETGDDDGPSDGPAPDPVLRALSAVLGPLRRPPSRPPASARDLQRDPGQLFAPDSDFLPQLLAAVDPRLRDGLYTAWHQVDVTRPLALRGLQALGVVAVPFGATAPLKPDLLQGRLVGQTEWPLTGSQQLDMVIRYHADTPDSGRFHYAEESGGSWGEAPPPPPHEAGVEISFSRGGQVQRSVFLSHGTADQNIHLTVSGDVTLDLTLPPSPDPQIPDQGGVRVDVKRTRGEAGDAVVSITFSRSFAQVSQNILALDAVYDGIAVDSWVVVERPRKGLDPDKGGIGGNRDLARVITTVQEVRTVSLAAFGISGKVTQLVLKDKWLDEADTSLGHIRDATVYARGDALSLATEPVGTDVSGDAIELAQLYDGLTAGRWVVVTGERTDIPGATGVPGTELAMLAAVHQTVDDKRPGDTVHTRLILANKLSYTYRADTVHVYANVVRATQGASRNEPIGSGDASRAGQTFTLFQGPLTWLAADTPLGAASTLEIRVDGVLWHEVDSFAGRGPDERVYVTSTGADGKTRVTFGDGVHGARLPTGSENVRAHYRVGLGHAGNLKAGQITQLASRPLGVSGVNNPLPATGGADPDDARQVRRGIPIAVTALDRLVGVPDYENFARARAGIGRASARQLFDGARQIVHVTIAGAGDIALSDDSDIMTTLRASLGTFGDPQLPVAVAVRDAVLLLVAATIQVAPDYSFELVEPKVRAALYDRLGFAARELGQPAYLSEVVAAAQAVPGVDFVDVDIFTGLCAGLTPERLAERLSGLGPPQPVVPARLATYDVTRYRVAVGGETVETVAAKNAITVDELRALNPDIGATTRTLAAGRVVVVFRGVRPAQLVTLSPALPDTLILKEARP